MGVPYRLTLAIPGASEMGSARPVMGATLGGLTNAVNYFAGYRFRRVHHAACSHEREDGAINEHGHPPDASAVNQQASLFLPTYPLTSHIFVALDVAANATGGSTPPTVTAALQKQDGTVLDIGVQWARADGTLPAAEAERFEFAGVVSERRPEVVTVTTGANATRDGLAAGGAPSGPRLLLIPESNRGDDLQLVVTSAACRVLSISAFEYWDEELP